MTERTKVGTLFFANAAAAVEAMREAGMTETTIASIVVAIRAAAIAEERLRVKSVVREHPPYHPTFIEMREAIADLIGTDGENADGGKP